MELETIRKINALNAGFYRANHQSFSGTRVAGWDGWQGVCGHLPGGQGPLRVLDVACGNMRFERYLHENYPHRAFAFTCLDSSAELARPLGNARFHHVDIVELLVADDGPLAQASAFDAAVSFGFMHHVPSHALRVRLMQRMVESLAPGGVAALSFWQFQRDAKLAAKAERTTREGVKATGIDLEVGDYLLGWNNVTGTYRYCHAFEDAEIDQILDSVADNAYVIDRFSADGRTGAMNAYAVVRRRQYNDVL